MPLGSLDELGDLVICAVFGISTLDPDRPKEALCLECPSLIVQSLSRV